MPGKYFHIDWLTLSGQLLKDYEDKTRSPICFDPERPEAISIALERPTHSRYTGAKNRGIRLNANSLAAYVGCSRAAAQKHYMEKIRALPFYSDRRNRLYYDIDGWARIADSFYTDGQFFNSFDQGGWHAYLEKSIWRILGDC